MSTFRKVRLFATPAGNLSWRYVDTTIISSGEPASSAYYICTDCRSLVDMHFSDANTVLEECNACTPTNEQ
jgi:hypothetical protein